MATQDKSGSGDGKGGKSKRKRKSSQQKVIEEYIQQDTITKVYDTVFLSAEILRRRLKLHSIDHIK